MAALSLDHARHTAAARRAGPWLRRLAVGTAAALVFVPSLVVLWPNLPITTRPVVLPAWFEDVGAHLPAGNVLLVYPTPFSGLQSSQAWQAVNRMQWAQAGGGGPTGQAQRAGPARPGFEVLSQASLALGPAPVPTAANVAAVRQALGYWGVTIIVVPDQGQLPPYERGRSTVYALGLLTAVVGRPPAYRQGSWVWTSVQSPAAPVMSVAAFERCAGTGAGTTPQTVPGCILGRS